MGDVMNNLTSVPKILDKGGSMYGNSEGCIIWDKDNRVIIRGYRGDKNMYQYNLGESNIDIMEGQVIDDKGVVYEKLLSGEEVGRAKEARKLHLRGHITENVLAVGLDNGCYANVNGLTGQDVRNAVMRFGKCLACIEGGMKAPYKNPSRTSPETKVGKV